MKLKKLLIYFLCFALITGPVLADGFGLDPDFGLRDPSEIFSFDARHHLVKDRISGTAISQTYAGTNRTRINSAGLFETVGANTPVIDHIGTSLEPALRLEPAAANILLGAPPVTQDLTLPIGSYSLQVLGAGTATPSALTATITGEAAASNGTPNVFTVTVAGTVRITIATATVVWLCPGAIPSSYFDGAAAIGSELVTDGGFAAVTVSGSELVTNGTMEADSNWNDYVTPATNARSNEQAHGGTYSRKVVTADTENEGIESDTFAVVAGNCYYYEIWGYSADGTSPVFTIKSGNGTTNDRDIIFPIDSASWTKLSGYYNAAATGAGSFMRLHSGGQNKTWYFDDATIKQVTFTNWTAGAGWAPQATAGALTGKVQKIAGTASFLTSTSTIEAYKVYRVMAAITRSAGNIQPYLTETALETISANEDMVRYYISDVATSGAFRFYASTTFVGTVDTVSVKEHGTVRLSEANTVTLAVPAAVAAALAVKGTIVIKGRFAFARAAGVVTAILSSQDATTSLAYTTTAAGNLSSFDATTVAESTGAYAANVDWKIAITFPSSAGKYRIGVDVNGAGIVQGAEVNFDGNFTTTANLILGRVLHGATHIKYIKIFDKVLTNPQIDAIN